MDKVSKPNEEWRKTLTPEAYKVTCEGSTEAPGTGKYLYNKETGMYECVRCGNPLFSSDTKFDSGTGWPSFWDVAKKGNVDTKEDLTLGMVRTEVICSKCGAHLGHVFDDGPTEHTGLRYCINSAALNFKKK